MGSKQASVVPIRRRIRAGKERLMGEAFTSMGVIVLFLVIFAVGISWATRGHCADADNEDLGVVAKDH
jgi:hypothetical protein